jgi:2-aminoethylphosphonate-pyruvate transaminase
VRALVLAAGAGRRLGALGTELPKGFLPIGSSTLIELTLARMRAGGVSTVVIVTGHEAHRYEELAARHDDVCAVHNRAYRSSGTLASLGLGCEALAPTPDENVLVVHSDILFERRAIASVTSAPDGDTMLVSGLRDRGDEVFASGTPDGLLTGMSKDASDLDAVIGEIVGLSRFSGALLTDLARDVERRSDGDAVNYEVVLDGIAHQGRLRHVLVEDLVWGEVDDLTQLQRLRDHVHPAAERADEPLDPERVSADAPRPPAILPRLERDTLTD